MTQTTKVSDDFTVSITPKLPGDDNITVPHGEGNLIIAYPFYGPNNALGHLKAIEADNQKLAEADSDLRIRQAQMPEVISIVAPAYKRAASKDQVTNRTAKEITSIMDDGYARAATGVLYHPDTELAYFVPNPQFNDESVIDTADLVRRVESGKEKFATAPFEEIRREVRDLSDLEDAYVLGFTGGQEGVRKSISIGERTPARQAYLWVPNLNELKAPEGRVAELNVYDANGLNFGGDLRGINEGSSAFGVLENTGEASRAEKQA
jgi:hypothetical protein